jgi:hypothetical protein
MIRNATLAAFHPQYHHTVSNIISFLEIHEPTWFRESTKQETRLLYVGRLLEAAHIAGE